VLRRRLTWDQGRELTSHGQIAVAIMMDICTCDAIHTHFGNAAPTNTPMACFASIFPTGAPTWPHTVVITSMVVAEVNGRLRETLGWENPAERLASCSPRRTSSRGGTTPGIRLLGRRSRNRPP
jgi:IS30 family transposase